MHFVVPSALQAEHAELHADLAHATRAGGKTGSAANAVAELLHKHFEAEDRDALPPLGLLVELAQDPRPTPEMREVLRLTDRLSAELPRMLDEHRAIVRALETLMHAADEEAHPEVVDFASRLMHHARVEEQVLYPAALLVGAYVRAQLDATRAQTEVTPPPSEARH